jgi:hypothetical protein
VVRREVGVGNIDVGFGIRDGGNDGYVDEAESLGNAGYYPHYIIAVFCQFRKIFPGTERSRISSVEPLMSANSAVTVLRSPSSAPASAEVCSDATCTPEASPGADEVTAGAPALFVSRAPHLPQNSDVGGFSALHCAQCFASAFPHFAQKLFVEGLFVPQLEQRIGLPTEVNDLTRFLYHACVPKGIAN